MINESISVLGCGSRACLVAFVWTSPHSADWVMSQNDLHHHTLATPMRLHIFRMIVLLSCLCGCNHRLVLSYCCTLGCPPLEVLSCLLLFPPRLLLLLCTLGTSQYTPLRPLPIASLFLLFLRIEGAKSSGCRAYYSRVAANPGAVAAQLRSVTSCLEWTPVVDGLVLLGR
jgi:hypothetical protein